MANCENCGTKINAFNSTYPLWDETEKRYCSKCKMRFDKVLKEKKAAVGSISLTHEFVDSIAPDLGFSNSGIQYLHDWINALEGERTKREQEELELLKQTEEDVARERELNKELAKILISSGFNFDGYRIVKYSGYISGDDAVQIPRSGLFDRGQNGKNLTDALVRIRRQALKELKQAAYDLGCNAVIGVDFDYITLDPETATITGGTLYEPYVICVTANGNAVVIEKIED